MIRNNLKIAFRNLWKHQVFSFINVMGLSVGMTACFLIGLYVNFELSYDAIHSKSDRIYRLVTDLKTQSETLNLDVTSWSFAPHIKQDFPEVESFVRVNTANLSIKKGNVQFRDEKALFADSSFFNVFDFKLLRGNPETALKDHFNAVLSEKSAAKYFGKSDPIGKTLFITDKNLPVTITGVMADIPENSQIKADVLLSMSTFTQKLNNKLDENWGDFGTISYLVLKPGSLPSTLEKKLPAFMERHAGKMFKETHVLYTLFLEPLKRVHLYSTRNGEGKGSVTNVYTFLAIAIFILLIACINFINLSTARSAERAKEVGIRKSVGAGRVLLARQFVGESVLISLIAFAFTLLFSAALIPSFNDLAGKTVSPGILSDPLFLIALFALAVVIGVVAGIYPAFVISSFDPVQVLKGRFTTGLKGVLLRKMLVTVQFAISTILIIATLVVYVQMKFMRSRDLGFNKDQILVVDSGGDRQKDFFKQSLKSLPDVKSVSGASSTPGGAYDGAYSEIENKSGDLQVGHLGLYLVDFEYIPQYQLKMVAGRSFAKEFSTDTSEAMMINEAAVKLLGYSSPQDVIGKRFKQWGKEGKIIGVIKDFHYLSLHEKIKPLTMRIDLAECNFISIKISAGNTKATLGAIQAKWKAVMPGKPFSYYFMDEYFDRQYRSEERFEKLFFNFAALAIFISCLGLLGLASYNTAQRTKEIGVRKVMGASTGSIVSLLSKDFLKLVLLAFVIASPIAWYGMQNWLKNFAYQTEIKWWIFAIAAILSVVIAFATISFQSIRAALMNPVKSLRMD
jgi:putative ABC transport system permease protein